MTTPSPLLTSLRSTRDIDYRMWATLMLTLLLPSLYTTVRIYFLGELPSAWGYNIASQLAWINVVYEVVHEALLLPLYYLVGTVISDRTELRNRVITGVAVSVMVYALLGLGVFASAPRLISLMAQAPELIRATTDYIRLETVAKLPEVAFQFLTVVLVLDNRYRVLLKLLATQLLLTLLLDTFVTRIAPLSLSLGVNGIAISNLIGFTVVSLLAYRAVRLQDPVQARVEEAPLTSLSFAWLTEWRKVGGLSGIESFVRNAAFILMILRMVNVVEEAGTFWITNSFIWGWLLLPVLSLGTLVRRDVARDQGLALQPGRYLWVTAAVVGLWVATVPIWPLFVEGVMGVESSGSVVRVALISLPFYVAFAFNNVIDSVFYGRGRTDLMLVQALLVNALVYGTAFLLFRAGVLIPTLTAVAILFGVGIALDSLLTFLLYFLIYRRRLAKAQVATEVV